MKKIVPLIGLLTLTLFAVAATGCDFDSGYNNNGSGETFYAQNFITNKPYTLKATKLYDGGHCVIWAENGSGVTGEQAQIIANEYDNYIYPMLVEKFCMKNFSYQGMPFINMLDWANWAVGGTDKKLTILLLDIKDGYKPRGSYIAGYFNDEDIFSRRNYSHSNLRDMIYIDTNPGLLNPEEAYSTLAHEAQHMINFVTSLYMVIEGIGRNGIMDTWIDEGLSSQAEYFYQKKDLEQRYKWFSEDPEGTIAEGNNFFVWGNKKYKENEKGVLVEISNSILDEYATVYLFFRWLYLQGNANDKKHIFYDIITSSDYNHEAVTTVAKKLDDDWEDWENLLRTWLAANYYPDAAYGYKGDSYLQGTIKAKAIGENDILLLPGEGVYSLSPSAFMPSSSPEHIRYTGLAGNKTITKTIADGSSYTGAALITFNANTNGTEKEETGKLTGVTPPPKTSVQGRSAVFSESAKSPAGPYRIDAQDLMGRNRSRELPIGILDRLRGNN